MKSIEKLKIIKEMIVMDEKINNWRLLFGFWNIC
jgi:hypothetical protein